MRVPTLPVHNVHRRRLDADADTVGELMETVGAPGDQLWPVPDSAPIRISRPLAVGADGAHGPAAYRVVGYQPQRWLRMEFTRPRFLRGFHEFSIQPDGHDGAILQHLLAVQLTPLGWLAYPLALKALHNQVIEMLLDRAELATCGQIRSTPARLSRMTRVRLAALKVLPSTTRRNHPARRRQQGDLV